MVNFGPPDTQKIPPKPEKWTSGGQISLLRMSKLHRQIHLSDTARTPKSGVKTARGGWPPPPATPSCQKNRRIWGGTPGGVKKGGEGGGGGGPGRGGERGGGGGGGGVPVRKLPSRTFGEHRRERNTVKIR